MMTYSEALELIYAVVAPLAPIEQPLGKLIGSVSSVDSHSKMAVPSFANAAMDGFALLAGDTDTASSKSPLLLKVSGITAAGDTPADRPPPGTVIEIMTGAAMPAGCDAVVPIERAAPQRSASADITAIRLEAPVKSGQNVRAAGEDYALGQTVLTAGRAIEPHNVMALAATGTDTSQVRAPARIAIVTTGSELVARGTPAGDGMIRDANGPYLEAFLTQTGACLSSRSHVRDDPQALEGAFGALGPQADVILTTGGVSAGRYDLIPDVIKHGGGDVIFHKVAVRPGKPLLFARLGDGTLFFGLPGNPIAVAVCMRFFVVPALRRLQGLSPEHYHVTVSDEEIRKRTDLRFFGKAVARIDADGRLRTRLLPGQESFKIQPLGAANCWAIVPEGQEHIGAGELIQVAPLYPTGFLQSPNSA
jgi:molybdopterin molybdotransferase